VADLFDRQPGDAQPEDVKAVPGQVPLIVEALLNQIRIERPTGQVLVKGRVERLSAWPRSATCSASWLAAIAASVPLPDRAGTRRSASMSCWAAR
jgi:hypothetical protein